jgi:hypothetical protein
MRALGLILKSISTVRDGQSYCTIRILMLLFGLALVGLAAGDLILNHHFNPVEFGTGAATILGAGGFGIAAKAKDEPDPS